MILRNVNAISKYLGTSPGTFRKRKDVDDIPYYVQRGVFYADTEKLDEWLKTHSFRKRGQNTNQTRPALWVVVDLFNKELPLGVFDSAGEAAKFAGTTKNAVATAVSHSIQRGGKSRFVRIYLDEMEDEDEID